MDWLTAYLLDRSHLDQLFWSALITTAITHFSALVYFRGLVGFKRAALTIWWDQETLNWLLGILTTIGSILSIFAGGVAAFPLYAAAAFAMLVVGLAIMVMMLAKHDLPEWLFWMIFAIIVLSSIVGFILGFVLEPVPPGDIVTALLFGFFCMYVASLICLAITLIWKFFRALYESAGAVVDWILEWFGYDQPQTPKEGGKSAVPSSGSVDNPSGALANPGGPGTGQPAVVHPDSCITIDFGDRKISDLWGKPDIRILMAPVNVKFSVQVSNDGNSWESCSKDSDVPTDWDVPWYNSPWRYVKICNVDNQPFSLWDVLILSR